MEEHSEQFNSKGVQYLNEKDYASAIKYFAEAVKLDGNLNAAYNLGYCFFNGYGVDKNYKLALEYFTLFEKLNDKVAANAMYLAGYIYYHGGYGIQINKNKAKECFRRAAENGHSWALLEFGRMLQLEGNYSAAKDCIQAAMKTGTNDYALQKEGKRLLKWNGFGRFMKSL